MMEKDWLASDDPQAMLAWATAPAPPGGLRPPRRGWYPSDRKFRLFACACCAAGFPAWRRYVQPAEVWAETGVEQTMPERDGGDAHQPAVIWCYLPEATFAAMRWTSASSIVPRAVRAALLREVAGNPFRRPLLAFNPPGFNVAWWERNHPHVLFVATAAYEERLPDGRLDPLHLGVLSDALEEAGITDGVEILSHLRSPGPHVRGCWALDLILGKE